MNLFKWKKLLLKKKNTKKCKNPLIVKYIYLARIEINFTRKKKLTGEKIFNSFSQCRRQIKKEIHISLFEKNVSLATDKCTQRHDRFASLVRLLIQPILSLASYSINFQFIIARCVCAKLSVKGKKIIISPSHYSIFIIE